jgi:glycosyltransferase involved in cell wall biosynthesis
MNILLLTRYDRLGASSRLRCLDYLPYLRGAGFDITVAPFFDDAYLERLYAGTRTPLPQLLTYYRRRLKTLSNRHAYDLIWLEKEALPWLPGWLESRLLRGMPLVIDFDDAWFHRYDAHPNPVVRRVLGGKFGQLVRQAHTIVAGNDYLANWSRTQGAKNIVQIPTVLDPARYTPQPVIPTERLKLVIGWMGSPSSAKYLQVIKPALHHLVHNGLAELHLVGSGPVDLGFPVTILPWQEATEAAQVQNFDIGIMPLTEDQWSRGKCAYKLLQYMASGLPVVASPVEMNKQVVQQGINGYLASTEAEWVEALTKLCHDPALRQRMGAAGRQLVEAEYSLQGNAPKLITVLTDATQSQ